MKIAFIGAQCSGKTTTLWHVGVVLKKLGLTNFTLVQEVARACPYEIEENAAGFFIKDNWILLSQILAEIEAHRLWKHIITDRSVFDELPYYHYQASHTHNKFSELMRMNNEYAYIRTICDAWDAVAPYDIFFLFHPLSIVADAQRTADAEYQREIDEWFTKIFRGNPKVIEVTGKDKTARTKFVTKHVIKLLGVQK